MTHDISIEIKKSDGKIIAIGQIALPEEVVDGDLLVTITTTELEGGAQPAPPGSINACRPEGRHEDQGQPRVRQLLVVFC